jgi:hypothetical protein
MFDRAITLLDLIEQKHGESVALTLSRLRILRMGSGLTQATDLEHAKQAIQLLESIKGSIKDFERQQVLCERAVGATYFYLSNTSGNESDREFALRLSLQHTGNSIEVQRRSVAITNSLDDRERLARLQLRPRKTISYRESSC